MSEYSERSESYKAGYALGYVGEVPEAEYDTDLDYASGYLAGDEDYENNDPDLSGNTSFDFVEPYAYQDWGAYGEDVPEWRPRGDAPMGAG